MLSLPLCPAQGVPVVVVAASVPESSRAVSEVVADAPFHVFPSVQLKSVVGKIGRAIAALENTSTALMKGIYPLSLPSRLPAADVSAILLSRVRFQVNEFI